jgi:hypothetical protein
MKEVIRIGMKEKRLDHHEQQGVFGFSFSDGSCGTSVALGVSFLFFGRLHTQQRRL